MEIPFLKMNPFVQKESHRLFFFSFLFFFFFEIGAFKCTSQLSWDSVSFPHGSEEHDESVPVLELWWHAVESSDSSARVLVQMSLTPPTTPLPVMLLWIGHLTCLSFISLFGDCPWMPVWWVASLCLNPAFPGEVYWRYQSPTANPPPCLLLRCLKGQAQWITAGHPALWADLPGLLVRKMVVLVILTILKSMVTRQKWPRPSLPHSSTQLSRSGSANSGQWAKSGHHGFCK